MKEHRHPHPHLDPRRPRAGDQVRCNPPLFAWKPVRDGGPFVLEVAADSSFGKPVTRIEGLTTPLFLPEKALDPGCYWWRWSQEGETSEVFAFTVGQDAVTLEVPPAREWLRRLPQAHPRLHARPEWREQIRELAASEHAEATAGFLRHAEELVDRDHHIDEPPFLPDRTEDYQANFRIWYPTMWNSRKFVKGAETLALASLVTGEERFSRAACERMVSISRWDPEGSTYLGHNDEAHMSVIWHGPSACDWVWESFTAEELELVIDQYRRRGQITFDHMHDRGSYGISRFDSHAGREIVFLANIALVFHEHIPEASDWLAWLRPVLCGVWPVWARDDGGWAQGPSYGLAYVTIQTMFASAMKTATGVDVYRRPFWRTHARWRQWVLPPYAEWQGFGDHTQRWASSVQRNADLIELVGLETGTDEFDGYVQALRAQDDFQEEPSDRQLPGISAHLYMAKIARAIEARITAHAPDGDGAAPGVALTQPAFGPSFDPEDSILRVFPAVGWAALRTRLGNDVDGAGDVAFVFRSSPFGAISHSHANNNDFILHVGGRVMAMPSGFYGGAKLGYGGDHHAHWVWHTKSHNCVTLSDAGQLMRSEESTGDVQHAFEDEHLVYLVGVADASYADRAQRCRRHVLFLKEHTCFLMIDEFRARAGVVSALQWNVHSYAPFEVDEEARRCRWQRGDSAVEAAFLYHDNAFFGLTEGWDPPPGRADHEPEWPLQYHLRFTCSTPVLERNLAVVLAPSCPGVPAAAVRTARHGVAEAVFFGDGGDRAIVDTGKGLEVDGERVASLAVVELGGCQYGLSDEGLAR